MKISSKLIVLIGLSVVMIGVQFAIGGYINSKMVESLRTAASLGRTSDGFLNAIIEERNFAQTLEDQAFDAVMRYLKEADEEIKYLETGSSMSADNVNGLKSIVTGYRERFTRLAQVMREISDAERDFSKAAEAFNERAESIGNKLSDYIGSRLLNAEDVPDQFRVFQEISQQATMLVNLSHLALSQNLMLKNDLGGYVNRNERLAEPLQICRKNATAICRYLTGQEYTDFVQQALVPIIDRIPEQTARIHTLWKDKQNKQWELDEIRRRGIMIERQIFKTSTDQTNQLANRFFWASLIAICITVLAVFLVGIGIMRSISRPITGLTRVAGQVAAGDLRDAVRQLGTLQTNAGRDRDRAAEGDEIGRLSTAFASMVESLHSLIGHVRSSGIQVVSSATEISASARELEASAAQQAASVNQVSVTSRQISSGSRELVQTMGGVVAVASETAALAQEGQTGLQGMEAMMRRLMEATGSIASKLETISDKTNNIGSVVTTINRVADRTNLLSLNAAIEAEKAGEFGMGFSVVAREIRRLADHSAVATLDIEQMVKEMQSAVSSGVMEVDKFVQQVRHGGEVIEKIGGRLAAIIDQVQALIPRFDDVNRAMEAQSTSAEEISGAMHQLSEGAEQTRQVVSEFNRVVEQLTDAVRVLQEEVSKFQLDSVNHSEA